IPPLDLRHLRIRPIIRQRLKCRQRPRCPHLCDRLVVLHLHVVQFLPAFLFHLRQPCRDLLPPRCDFLLPLRCLCGRRLIVVRSAGHPRRLRPILHVCPRLMRHPMPAIHCQPPPNIINPVNHPRAQSCRRGVIRRQG